MIPEADIVVASEARCRCVAKERKVFPLLIVAREHRQKSSGDGGNGTALWCYESAFQSAFAILADGVWIPL